MHSAEPFDPLSANLPVDTPTRPSPEDESWRAEVASRVNNYRARRKRSASDDNPPLDFAPAAEVQNQSNPSFGDLTLPKSDAPRSAAQSREASRPARNAFDTNYYRRLNAESMSRPPAMLMGAAVEATDPEVETVEAGDTTVPDAEVAHPLQREASSPVADLELHPAPAGDSVLDRYRISEAEPEPPNTSSATPPPVPAPQGNLIVFRRPLLEPPLLPQPAHDELAEPMNRRPRILEVPEDIMPAVQGSLFPEIRLDADVPEGQTNREPEIEVPLCVAPLPQRLMASLADLSMVLGAGLLFGAMAWRALPGLPHAKPFFMILGAVTVLFWAVYQHLFLLYGGRTPGMSLVGIHLSTFDGHAPVWKQRSRRARFMCISFASVGLGFLWALVDQDALCWHDRISQTFPTTD
jgi:uncharacterized RDD family membrane protein YckC